MMRPHNDDQAHDNLMMQSHHKMARRDHSVVQVHNKGRLRDWVKLGLAATIEATGLLATYRALRTYASGARIHVLGYHRVVDAIDWDGPINPSLCITTEAFRRQMEQLRERFVVLPLSYVARALAGEMEIPHDAVCVTFDDGYRDVIVRAHNILHELDIPGTVFVPTGFGAAEGAERFLPHDRLYAGLWRARHQGLPLARLVADVPPTGEAAAAVAARATSYARDADDLAAGEFAAAADAPFGRGAAADAPFGRGAAADAPFGRGAAAGNAALFARVDHLLAQEGPASAVECLIRSASATTLARAITALEARLGPPALDDGAAVLSPAEVRTLADGSWEIGAHTIGHVVLTHEPLAEARRQVVASKHDIERWSGRPCRFFAYCNGFHSPAVVDELRRAGYEGAVTTHDRPNVAGHSDPFRISRKILWEGHARGPHGRFSPALSAAHLHDLFGLLGLTAPLDGHMEQAASEIVQLHNKERATSTDVVQAHNESEPTEVELAY